MASSRRRRIATAATGTRSALRGFALLVVVLLALLVVAGAEGRRSAVTPTEVALQVLASPNGGAVEVTPDVNGNQRCESGFVVCTFQYSAPTTVTLTADASDAASRFYGWTAAECPSGGNPCELALTGDDPVVSAFALYDPVSILVAVAGPGTLKWLEGTNEKECVGEASSTTQCVTGLLPARRAVRFTAVPSAAGYAIDWAFSCEAVLENAAECSILPESRIVGVGFNHIVPDRPFDVDATLRLKKTGSGDGRITGSGFNCGSGEGCRKLLAFGAAVTLQAEHAAGSRFDGWIGVCGSNPTCRFNAGPVTSATARFVLAPPPPPPPPKLKVSILKLAASRAAGRWRVTARIASNEPIRARARVGRRRLVWGDRTVNVGAGRSSLTVKLSRRARRGKSWVTLVARTNGGEVRKLRRTVKLGR